MLARTDKGLYCPAGGFHIDPWEPVDKAVITHAHADHARWGSRRYIAAGAGERLLRARLGEQASILPLGYGEPLSIGPVKLSLHPAGHILGSSQVRLEHKGEVWVVSGDFKTAPDPTCAPFEPVRCHVFVTESTFGLPIFRWPAPYQVMASVNAWWKSNREAGRASLLLGYAVGKAQRLLAGLDLSIGPVYTHGAVEKFCRIYRLSGVPLPPVLPAFDVPRSTDFAGALILAPPSAQSTPWVRRFGELSRGLASGWMRVRGIRRRRVVDRGFVLSDHADWPGLLDAIRATGAERVWVTHGYASVLARWLSESGLDATTVDTPFVEEDLEDGFELARDEEAGSGPYDGDGSP